MRRGKKVADDIDPKKTTIDAVEKRLTLEVNDAELARRKASWTAPPPRVERGVLAKYARCVRSASEGAVTS